jgi:ribosome-binding protein aMBF1 (putative translation factor)
MIKPKRGTEKSTRKVKTDAAKRDDGMSKTPDLQDLFLNDELLLELAMRELRGKRPPAAKSTSADSPLSHKIKSKLQRELEGRGWTYRDLAMQVGIPAAEAQALARGGQRITPEVATKLGRVFATSTDYWLREED